MEEPFKPLSLSIRELFGNADSLYKIPQYQRPYKWEDEQIDKLWDDVYDAFESDESNYFLGSIVTAKPRGGDSGYLDVVDGQQRLTTLMILFCVVRDLYPNINKDASGEDPFTVDIDTIMSSISLYGKTNRLKLFTHLQHQTDFDNLILKGNTTSLTKPFKYEIHTDEEPKFKFINTAVLFRDKLKNVGEKISPKLINYLFNKVKIIRIDCNNREFAIKLFQVINDRGMDLTAADLIKSFLIEKLGVIYKDDSETLKIKEDQFIADWREMEQTVKSCDINMNDLFIMYEYYILGQNPKKSLFDELQDAFKNLDPNKVIGDIKNFAQIYNQGIFEARDKIIYSFWYIKWAMYWKTILTTALHSQYPEFDKLTRRLRRFYYLYWIAGKTMSQIKQMSFNLIKWINSKKTISEIEAEFNQKLVEDKIIELAKRNLTSEQIGWEPWCKPLLLLMEYNATDNSKLSHIDLDKDLHLEHILPFKYDSFKEWNHINKELAARWLNSAGNLTLLSGAKNISASNNPFDVKIGVYKGKGKYDSKDDKITAFLITQKIVSDYELKTYSAQWNEKAMIDRWKWFFKEVQELLQIDLVDEIRKHDPISV